jgi:hypothetical protein
LFVGSLWVTLREGMVVAGQGSSGQIQVVGEVAVEVGA